MKKFIILVLGLSLTAASCNLFSGAGSKGVLKSEDGGQTFATANKLEKKGEISGLNVNSFTFDPTDPDILFVGSSSGIHKSTDGAQTWKFILTGMKIGDIVVDGSKNDIVYGSGIRAENGKIVKTNDGGATWKDIYTEPTKNNAVLSLAISKATAKVLLAGLNNGEIIRSTDEGNTWQLVRDLTNPVIDLEYTDSTTVYALTLNNGLYVSFDQGSNWNPITVSLVASANGTQSRIPTTRTYSDMAFDNKLKGVIFLATQQGLLRTIDGGITWTIMPLPVTNETLTVSAVAINPTNSNSILITIGSTFFKSNNGGVTWETRKLPTSQKVRHILISPDEPNKVYLGLGDG